MSYLQVIRAIAPPILSSLPPQLKSKKTSLRSFIPQAWAEEQVDPEIQEFWEFIKNAPTDGAKAGVKLGAATGIAVGTSVGGALQGATTAFLGGLVGGPFGAYEAFKEGKGNADTLRAATQKANSLAEKAVGASNPDNVDLSSLPLILGAAVGAPSGLVGGAIGGALGAASSAVIALLLGVSIVIDTAVTELEYLFSDKDDEVIRKAKKHLDSMIGMCQERQKLYYHQDDHGKMVLQNEAISQLRGKELKDFQEFQFLSELSSKLQPSYKQHHNKIVCRQLIERGNKDVNRLKRTKKHNFPTAVLELWSKDHPPL